MPRKTTTNATAPAMANTKNIVKKPIEKPIQDVKEDAIDPEVKQTYKVKNALTPNTFVTVKNGFSGRLVYKSSRTNEKFVWEEFGSEQDMELQELKNAKSAHKTYFEKNWFLFDDPEVIRYLGVERFYDSALSFDEFEDLFNYSPDEVKERISTIPDGQRQSLIYKAKQLISDGTIDSMKMVNALEESLGVELIER